MCYISQVNQQIVSSDTLVFFPGHSHPQWEELLICIEGTIGVKVGESREIYLQPDEGIFIPPGAEHLMWDARHDNQAKYYNVFYDGNLPGFRRLMGQHLNFSSLPIDAFWRNPLEKETAETGMMKILSLIIAAQNLVPISGRKSDPENEAMNLSDTFSSVIHDLIQMNPQKNHSRKELSSAFHLEAKYLSSRMKDVTGYPLMQFYYREKMMIAKKLLNEGKMVKEVSIELGFKNPYHFSRKFKEITGAPPSRINK